MMLQDSLQQPVWLVDCAACMTHSEQQGLVPSAALASVHGVTKYTIIDKSCARAFWNSIL